MEGKTVNREKKRGREGRLKRRRGGSDIIMETEKRKMRKKGKR